MSIFNPTTWATAASKLQDAGGDGLFWVLLVVGLLITGVVFDRLREAGNRDDSLVMVLGILLSVTFAFAWPLFAYFLCVFLWIVVVVGGTIFVVMLPRLINYGYRMFKEEKKAKQALRKDV